MKFLKTKLFMVLTAALLITACDPTTYDYDSTPPEPPTGLYTINGDGIVELHWSSNHESDLAGYNVYYSYSYDGEYSLIGNTGNTYFLDDEAVNGDTYYYAVTAYDYNGNESELSYDVIYETPRPEGFNVALSNYDATSGYDFSSYSILPFDDMATDFFFEKFEGQYFLNVWPDADIADMGATTDIYDINQAPATGYVPLYDGEPYKYIEAIPGHTYIVWTWDNHYAKVRIRNIVNDRLTFDWAYQTVEGSMLLKQSTRNDLHGKERTGRRSADK